VALRSGFLRNQRTSGVTPKSARTRIHVDIAPEKNLFLSGISPVCPSGDTPLPRRAHSGMKGGRSEGKILHMHSVLAGLGGGEHQGSVIRFIQAGVG